MKSRAGLFQANWDRILGWALTGVGVILMLVGAVQVADARYLVDQLSFLMSAGLGGLACLILGASLLLNGSLHDEWRKLDRIESSLAQPGSRPQ